MKVTKVNLEHFKGIERASINFGDLTVITGKNSSGKSSIIQSLKYLTQWFKRIQTTRGLNEFSAPSIQVIHPDFVTENKDYEAIRNSQSPITKGIALGLEINDTNNEFFIKGETQFSIHAEFENVSKEGNKVRPKVFYLSLPQHWNENRKSFTDDKFDVIYHNSEIPQFLERKDSYFEMYGNGQLIDRVLNNAGYMEKINHIAFNDDTKKTFLHLVADKNMELASNASSVNPWRTELISSLQNIQVNMEDLGEVDTEKALIINTKNERLSFESSNRLRINRYRGEKNVYLDLYKDYILSSFNNKSSLDYNNFNQDTIKELLDLVINIYHSEFEYRQLLSDYLQYDISSEIDYEDYEFGESTENPIIDTLNKDFLSNKKLPKKVMKHFISITNIVNSSRFPVSAIGAVQILLMYVQYINNLSSSRDALQLSSHMKELIDNENIFEEEDLPSTAYEKPLSAVVAIQNSLGDASQFIGYERSLIERAPGEYCTCVAPNAYYLQAPDSPLTKNLDPWEVVRNCPDNISVNSHIYQLTAKDEIDRNEPNAYTLRPKANIRGSKNEAIALLECLKEITLQQNAEEFELFYKILNDDAVKNRKSYKKTIEYLKNDELYFKARDRILVIEELEKKYIKEKELNFTKFDYLNKNLNNLKKNYTEEKEDLIRAVETELVDNEEYFSSRPEGDPEDYLEEDRTNLQILNIEKQIETLLDMKKQWDDKISEVNKEKQLLLNQLHELDITKEDFGGSWEQGLLKKIQSLINTKYVSINPDVATIDIDSISADLKYLNTGRNPSAEDRPGEFFDNLPVGKTGGRLTDLMYEEGRSKVYPFLYPSVKEHSEEEYTHTRSFNDLDWHTIKPEDEKFLVAFNMWISYLNMEISQVESKVEGPKPQLKVTGKDGVERDVFEVGSGIGQVLPVVAICLLSKPGEVVCIEEPEAHLHPSAQAYLADFLLAMAASGRQIIVETHSPNIIDRLRLRKVHKKSWKKFQNNEWIKSELYLDDVVNIEKKYKKFREPEIKIIFAEQDHNGFSNYREASIDRKGDIIFGQSIDEIWPDGFFDNAQQELSYILKARISAEEE